MFNSLTGELTGHEYPLVMISTGGVEWSVEVSAATFRDLLTADRSAGPIRILTWLYVREDAMRLFGFADTDEREAFIRLLKVPGIGARQALRVLSGTTVTALARMLDEENIDALSSIPGIGRKTAQKIVLQLKGTLATGDQNTPGGLPAGGPYRDIVEALVEMGYERKAAQDAVESAAAVDADGVGEQDLFRRAIVALSGG